MGKETDWNVIQLSYQKGEGNCRELAERYGVTAKAVQHRCTREGWKKEAKLIGELVGKRTVETLAEKRVKEIEALENEAVPIARKLQRGVELSFDSMHGEPIDSAHLQGLAMALKTSNAVARLNLGAVDPSTKVDVTSGGLSMHQSMLAMIEASRKMASEGKLLQSDVDAIDVKGLLSELEESKREDQGK